MGNSLALSQRYAAYINKKILLLGVLGASLVLTLLVSLSLGAAQIPLHDVLAALSGTPVDARLKLIIWNIRLPQALSALLAGAGLAISGTVMQSILRNPLGSPFTLGISHAAAFGAALAVMLLGGFAQSHHSVASSIGPYCITATAFALSIITAALIVLISRHQGTRSEVMVLSGVALGSLFTAATMFLQLIADDVQLAAMVFWTFGDTARASWTELSLMSVLLALCSAYFLWNSWAYNAIDIGDETAQGLGVQVSKIRFMGMLAASLLTACIIAFLGIIGFVGLVVPHICRKLTGADHRFLLPASFLGGALLLLLSDTAARLILAPHILPVSVLTAFMGAPIFLYLIIKGQRS